MKKVFIITDVDFWVGGAGHRMRISSLVEFLNASSNLTIGYIGLIDIETENYLNSYINAKFYFFEKYKHLDLNSYGLALREYLKNNFFDVFIIEYIHNSYLLNYIDSDSKFILDVHDIISDRIKEFKKFGYKDKIFQISKKTELQIFNVFDKVIFLCEIDCNKIKAIINPEKVLLCPHPAVAVKIHRIRVEVKNIVFIASEYTPNKDGILHFIENCWPELIKNFNVHLLLYGNICNVIKLPNYKNIFLKGYCSNIAEAYEQADIIINPVRFGAGLKIKNIEALANGIPLVTTTHGARGLENGIDKAFLVANTAQGFISSLSRLIISVNLRKKLSKKAILYINSKFSVKNCFEPLLDEIK